MAQIGVPQSLHAPPGTRGFPPSKEFSAVSSGSGAFGAKLWLLEKAARVSSMRRCAPVAANPKSNVLEAPPKTSLPAPSFNTLLSGTQLHASCFCLCVPLLHEEQPIPTRARNKGIFTDACFSSLSPTTKPLETDKALDQGSPKPRSAKTVVIRVPRPRCSRQPCNRNDDLRRCSHQEISCAPRVSFCIRLSAMQ